MKTAKMIVGIISIVLTFLVLFQSCAASVGDALSNEGGTSGAAGTFVAVLMLIAGIVAIAARKSKGAGVFCLILYALAGIIGVTSHGTFGDLIIWGIVCFVFAAIFLLATIKFKKQAILEKNEEKVNE